jgi:excisionase family DNA binding protein
MTVQNFGAAISVDRRPPTVGRQLLTVPQVAEMLGVSTRKTWRLIAEGRIKTVRVGARGTRILNGELDTFIAGLPGQPIG